MAWHNACNLADLPKGRPTATMVAGQQVLLTRIDDAVYATSALCPHKFAPLEAGTVEPGCMLACPLHDAHFDLTTGDPRDGDGWAGHLATFPTRILDGDVQVDLADTPGA